MVKRLAISVVLVLLLFGPSQQVCAQRALPDSTSQAAQVEAAFVRALTEAYLGDHERAVELLTSLFEVRPTEPAILLALAESHEALGQTAEALFYASEAFAYGQHEPTIYHVLAALQVESNQPNAAIETYESLLVFHPRDVDALAEMGRLLERSGRLEDALTSYEQLLDITGPNPALLLRMEAIHARLGNAGQALRMLERAAQAFPNQGSLLMRLAMKYAEANRNQDAIETYEQLIRADPTAREAVLMLADLWEAEGNLARAEELRSGASNTVANTREERLQQAARLYERAKFDEEAAAEAFALLLSFQDEPNAPVESLLMLGDLAFNAKEFELSASVLKRALDQDPRHPEHWDQAAAAFLYSGDPIQALDIVEEGNILFPGRVGLHRVAAYAYARTGRPRNALRSVSEAISILELEDEACVECGLLVRLISFQGILQNDIGDLNGAIAAFEKALALEPDHALVLNNYAYILSENDSRLSDALEMAIRANELDRENAYFLDTLGWVYYKLGRYEEAAIEIEHALLVDEQFALLHEHLGDVYDKLGRSADAREAWLRALELEPDNISVQEKLNDN